MLELRASGITEAMWIHPAWTVLLLLLLGSPGCNRRAATSSSALDGGSPSARFERLMRDHLEASLGESPITATWLGSHGYDDRLDDLSAESQGRRLARARSALEQLAALPLPAAPGPRLAHDLLERQLRLIVLEGTVDRPLERNPARYVDLATAAIFDILVAEWLPLPSRMRSIDQRLRKFAQLFDESRRNLKAPPEILVRRALELGQGLRAFVSDTLPRIPAALGDELLSGDFRAAQTEALRALEDWLAWLQKDVLPKAKGDAALGRERLSERLRVSERLDMPFDALLTRAEQELERARLAFEEQVRLIDAEKTPTETLRALEEDHATAEQLLTSVVTTLESLAAFLRDHRLLTLPEARPKVAEMPAYLWGLTSLVMPGPLDSARDAYLFVEPVDPSWDKRRRDEHLRSFARPWLAMSLAHQALPGHFLQLEAARRATTVIEKISQSEAFVEGWPVYAQGMMLEAGYGGGDAKLRLVGLRDQLLRLTRLVASLRYHGQGARLDDIAELFAEEGYLDDYAARREAERVAGDAGNLWPGLGLLELRQLLVDVRREEGDAFTLRSFHDRVLAHGAPPIPLLRRLLLKQPGAPL